MFEAEKKRIMGIEFLFCRAGKEEKVAELEVRGDSSHLEDQVMKTAALFFGEDLLPFVGVEGKIAGIAPTEQIHLEVKRMEEDFNFLMEDGSWRHLEFESDRITEADLRRFREYDAYIGMAYQVPVVTTVLCSAKTKILKNELVNGASRYSVEIIRLKDQNADQLLEVLKRDLKNGKRLNRKQIVPLLLTPLMSGTLAMTDRICGVLDLLQSEQVFISKEEKKRMEAVMYALAIKFLNAEELSKVKERIRMTLLGQMLREDGRQEGQQEGQIFKLITLVKKKFDKGQSSEQIAEDLMEEREMIDRIVRLLLEHPDAEINEICRLWKRA